MGNSVEAWRRLDKFCANKRYFIDHVEDDFETDLRDILGLFSIASIHLKEGGELPLPDLLCFAQKSKPYKMKSFFIETKRKNKYKLSESQKAAFDLLRDYVHIESIKTWEEAILFLHSIIPKTEGGTYESKEERAPADQPG